MQHMVLGCSVLESETSDAKPNQRLILSPDYADELRS